MQHSNDYSLIGMDLLCLEKLAFYELLGGYYDMMILLQ